jgi:hypothetical protein
VTSEQGLKTVQRRKFAAAILAVLLVAIVAPIAIPRGHADDTSESITSTGYVIRGYNDPFLQRTVDAVKAGSVFSITVVFVANSVVFQRNMSLGIKFDWMNNFQNSSMANPQNQYSVFANQVAYLTLNYTIPNLTGQYADLNLVTHSWTVEVWDTASGATWTNLACFDSGTTSCRQFFNNNPIAIYSSQQSSGVLARQQANSEITALSTTLRSVLQAPPGSSNAVAELAAATTQLSAGDTAYSTGDFNGAQTDYQNSLNSANAAQSSLATTGGGTDTATLTSIWIEAVAILFGGIGALLVGIAGFKYLRARSRSISASPSYSPISAPKP